MQSSRWAPLHRRDESTAPSTNAAILGFKDDQASSQTGVSAHDILKYGKPVAITATSQAPPAQIQNPDTTLASPTINASTSPAVIATSSSTSINPQAPAYVPLAAQEAAQSINATSSFTQPYLPPNPYLAAQAMDDPAQDIQQQNQDLEHIHTYISPPVSALSTSLVAQSHMALGVGTESYTYGDPYAQTGGETSDLFFGDDFTPITRPVPQPVVQPMSEPVKSIEPQLQQINVASEGLPPVHQYQNFRGARDRGRGRVRGRNEGRGRGDGRGRGRGRGGRGRGGRDTFDEQVNGEPLQNGKLTAEDTHRSASPASDKPANTVATTQVDDASKESSSAPANAPSGPSAALGTPAVRGDRLASGGVRRPKLTEEELSAKLEAVRLKNQEREAAHRAATEDEANFRAQEKKAKEEAAVRRKQEESERRELMQERERNRLRKMKNMGVREWDEGKESAGLMDGTGRQGYGNGFRGRGHYRRGANGAIPGFVAQARDGPNAEGAGEDGPSQPVLWDPERGEPRYGRGRGDFNGRGGRGGRGRGDGRSFRGGRGGVGGGLRGDGNTKNNNDTVPTLTNSEFPVLGGGKAAAAKAAVEQASKWRVESKRQSASSGNNVGAERPTNPTQAADTGTDSHKNKRSSIGGYAAAFLASGEDSNGINARGAGANAANNRGHHARRHAIDESRIQSWADQVEEAM